MKRILVMVFLLVAAGLSVAQPNVNPAPPEFMVPAGTHVLLRMTSPLNTTSATAGSAVYCETEAPVIVNNRVVIPEHTRVMGAVADGRRPGRVKGRAQLRLNFTSLIFADNHVVPISAVLQGVPESARERKVDAQGTLEPVDQIDRDVRGVVLGAIPGAVLGFLGARKAGLRLGLLGGGLGLGNALFTRGDEVVLPADARVEMVFQNSVEINLGSSQ